MAREDPTFQRMEKIAQGTKQPEKMVNSPERRNKKQNTQDRRSQADLSVDIPKDQRGHHQLAMIGGGGKSEHLVLVHLIRVILLILHLLHVGDHVITMIDVV